MGASLILAKNGFRSRGKNISQYKIQDSSGSENFLFFRQEICIMMGVGYMKVKLLSVVKIIDARGKELDQGALIRWLGEAPWFPTALLPSEKLKWEPIDNDSAKVIFTDKDLTVDGVFYFNEQGQITDFSAKRYRYKDMEKWSGIYRDYKEIEGMHPDSHD